MSLRLCSDPFSIVKMVPPLQPIGITDESTSSSSLLLYEVEIFVLVLETTGWGTDLEVARGILCEKDKESLS
jgi:hypothetical protein